MEIKEASEEQLDRLVEIWLAGSLSAHDFIDPGYWQENTGMMRGLYLPLSENYIVAEGEEIYGFLSLMGNELAAIFIEPSQQQKGFGGTLIQYAQDLRPELTLNVYEKNKAALSFYREHGFQVVEKMWEEEVGECELRMKWQKEHSE